MRGYHKQKSTNVIEMHNGWWTWRDSNPRPPTCKIANRPNHRRPRLSASDTLNISTKKSESTPTGKSSVTANQHNAAQIYCFVKLSEAFSVAGPRIMLRDVMSAVPLSIASLTLPWNVISTDAVGSWF
jgi:hypothetical protein